MQWQSSNVLPLHFAPSQASSSQNSNVDNFYLNCHNSFKIPFKILRTLPAIDCLDLMPWIPVWSWIWVGMSKNIFPVQWMYWWSVENMAEEDCFWLLSVALLINPNLWTVKLSDKERFDKEKIGVKELLPTILNHKFTVR